MAVSGWAMSDVFVGEAEGFGGDLAEDGVGALAELGGGDEDEGPCRLRVTSMPTSGVEAALAGAGEAGAVKEGGEADAALDGAGGIFARELVALGVVVGFVEGAGEEVLHVDGCRG